VCIGTPAGVEATFPFLRSDDALVRSQSLDALAAMGSVVWDYLPGLLRDERPDVRVLVCDLVRGMPSHDAGQLLSNLLDGEESPNVCAAAVDALAELAAPAALPALERCAARFHATPYLTFAIAIAIRRIHEQAARPPRG
jgi:HEAT repeat protein